MRSYYCHNGLCNDHQAYLDGNSLIVLRPNKSPLKAKYSNTSSPSLADDEELDTLADTALVHALWTSLMYKERMYN